MALDEDLSSWDPLTEHYNDKNTNTYNTGAGAKLPSELQPAYYKKGDNRYTLWVRPLSSRYTTESLSNIFSNYGEVIDCWIVANPKTGSPFGYVSFKTQSAANAAIRGFNDNSNFDFKVSYAKGDNQEPRNRGNSNRDRHQEKNGHSSHQNKNKDKSKSFKSTDASDSYNYSDCTDESVHNGRSSRSYKEPANVRSYSPPKKNGFQTNQSIRESVRSSSPPNQDRKPAESGRPINPKPKLEVEPEMNSVAYVSPPQCSLCKKLTFMICSACHESFCNQECSIDGWRLHKGSRCIQVADLIRESNQNRELSGPDVTRKSIPSKVQFANDMSPGNEISKFAHLVEDYLENGRAHDSTSTKFVSALDNNYDDNVDGGVPETKLFRKPEPHKRYENKDSDNDRSRNIYGADSRGKRYDRESDNEKSRNAYGDSRTRKFDKDGAGDAEKPRSYSSDTGGDAHVSFRKSSDRRQQDGNDRKPKTNGFETDTSYPKRNAQSRIDKRYSDRRATDDENFSPQANSSAIVDIDVTPFISGRLRLKENIPCDVIVISIVSAEERLCYVKIAAEDETIKTMIKTLNEIKSFKPLDIVAKKKCVARYKDIWHRGLIESDSPLRVKLIDRGIVASVSSDDVREIPSVFAQIPPFAFSVKLPSVELDQLVSWNKSLQVVSIRPIRAENKTWIAEPAEQASFHQRLEIARKERDRVQADKQPPTEQKPQNVPLPETPPRRQKPETAVPSDPLRESDALLKAGIPKKVMVTFIQDKKVFFVADIEKFLDVFNKTAVLEFDSLKPVTEVEVGLLCLVLFSGVGCRARVISKSPLKVVYVDYGNVESCDMADMRILPEECAKIEPLAVQVRLMSGTVEENNVPESEPVVLTAIKKDPDTPNGWIVCCGDKSAEFEELKRQCDARESSDSSVVEIAPPKEVAKPPVVMDLFITYSISKSEYYAIRKSDASIFDSLNAKLSKSFEKADDVEKNIIYAKNFEGLWCRAQVVDLNPLTIYFIDYGNTECCKVEDLHRLPEDLQKNPAPLAFKVSLKNETHDLLEYGAWMNVLWDIDSDTYTLLRDPSATRPNEEQPVTVGSGVVNVVNALGNSRYAVILEDNRNMYKYIANCINSTLEMLPRPNRIKINDLCLAMYDDESWHRAKVTNLNPLTVYFLDFGNEAICDFSLIKSVPRDLAKIPPLAIIIQTEDYVTLEVGELVNISVQEEIDHGFYKVVVLKEKDRQPANSSKRLEIVADPQHVKKFIKKKPKSKITTSTPTLSEKSVECSSPTTRLPLPSVQDLRQKQRNVEVGSSSKDVISLIDDDSDVEFVSETRRRGTKKRMGMKIDTSSLVYTALSNPPPRTEIPTKPKEDMPKNLSKRMSMMSKGMEMLSLNNKKRNFTIDNITVPIGHHIIDMLKPDDNCVFIVHDSFSDDEYTGMLICKRLENEIGILDQLEELNSDLTRPIKGKQGELVAVYLNPMKQWYRACVIYEPSPVDPFYLLVLLDVGITYRTTEVFPLPSCFHKAPLLAVRLHITAFPKIPDAMLRLEVLPMTREIIEGDTYQHDKCIYKCEVTSLRDVTVEGKLWSSQRTQNHIRNDFYHVKFTPWQPTREEIGIRSVTISDGDIVKISAIPMTNECYLIPVDEELSEKRNQFLDDVVIHCQEARMIDHEPKIREIVGVPYLSSYWRGQILEKKKHSFIVYLLDLGSKVKILKEDIKPLPDSMKFVECYAVNVILDKIPRTDFNKEAENFLKFIVTHEKELTVHVKDTHLVELKFAEDAENKKFTFTKGQSLNEELGRFLTPLWRMTDEYDFAHLFFNNLKYEEWEIGSELSLYFVECLDEKTATVINRHGYVYAKLIEVNLVQRLSEYANEVSDPYLPVKDELCVAEFDDGEWYRAFCCDVMPGEDPLVQFIDIGFRRRVSNTNIRRIHPDFLKHPAAAMLCEVSNYTDCPDFQKLEGQVLRKCKVLEKIQEGGYTLEIAELAMYRV